MLNKKIAKRLLALAISLLLIVGTIPVLAEDLSPVIVDPTIAAEDSGNFSEEENSFVYKTISAAIDSFDGAPGKIFLKGELTAKGSEIEGAVEERGAITIAGYENNAAGGKLIATDVSLAGWLKGDLTFENITIGTSGDYGFDSNGHKLTFGTGTVSAGTLNFGGRYTIAGNNVVLNPGAGTTLNVNNLAARMEYNSDLVTKGATHYVINSGVRVENILAGITSNNADAIINLMNDYVLDINGGYFKYLYLGSMCYQAAVANKADTIININKLDSAPSNGIVFGHTMSQAYEGFKKSLNKSGNIAVIIDCNNMPGKVPFYNDYWPSYYLVPEDDKYFMIIANNYDPNKIEIKDNVKSVDYIINTVNGVAQPVFEDKVEGDDTSSVLKGFTLTSNLGEKYGPVVNGNRITAIGTTDKGELIYDLSAFKGTRVAKTLTDGSGNIIETHTTDTEPITITFLDTSIPVVTTLSEEEFPTPEGYVRFDNLSDAFEHLGAAGGTIYIKGNVVSSVFEEVATTRKQVTISGYGGDNSNQLYVRSNGDKFYGDIKLENISFTSYTNGYGYGYGGFYSWGHTLTFGENVKKGNFYNDEYSDLDCMIVAVNTGWPGGNNNVIINGGEFSGIHAYLYNVPDGRIDYNIVINGGSVGNITAGRYFTGSGRNSINGDYKITVNGGTVNDMTPFAWTYGDIARFKGDVVYNINGGQIKKITVHDTATNAYDADKIPHKTGNIAVVVDEAGLKASGDTGYEFNAYNNDLKSYIQPDTNKKIIFVRNNAENNLGSWVNVEGIANYRIETHVGVTKPVFERTNPDDPSTSTLVGFTIESAFGKEFEPYVNGEKVEPNEKGYYDLSKFEDTNQTDGVDNVISITFRNEGNYYVKYGGIGSGDTPLTPAKSVAWLINNVIADKHNADETVYIHIMQDDAEILYNSTIYGGEHEAEYIGGDGLNTPDSHITAWTSDADTTMVAHAATIVIKSYEDGISETNYLAYTHKLGANTGLALQGPTVFDNINLVSLRGSVPGIYASGHEVTFTENASHYRVDVDQYSNPAKQWDGTFPEAGWVIYEGTGWVPSVPTTLGKGGSINFNATEQNIEALYISAHNIDGFNFTNPVNLYLNAEVKQIESYQAKKLYIGNANTNFAGGINIAINKTAMLDFNIGNPYNIENIPTVGKGIQLIHAETYSAFNGHMLDRLQNVAANALATVAAAEKNNIPLWHIVLDEPAEGVLDFMFDENGQTVFGKYKVNDDKTLIAFNKDKEVFTYSKDGVLDLSAFEGGRFWVQFADEAEISSGTLKVGDTIVATKDITLTVADIPKNAYEGRAFIGWQKDGEFITGPTVTLAKGETLESIYMDYDVSSDFFVEGIQMRVDKADSIRFVLTLKKSLFNSLENSGATLIENQTVYGSLVLPTELTYGMDLVRGEAIVDREGKELATPLDVPAEKLFATLMDGNDEVGVQYTVAVTGVTGNKQIRNYSVQGYVRYIDANGNEQVLYSGYGQSSLYRVALRLADDEEAPQNYRDEANKVVNNVKTTVKADYLDYVNKNTTTIPNVLGLTNLTIKKLANGLQLSDFDIDWKYNEGDSDDTATNILDIADTHFVYNNRNDFAIGNPAVISSGIKRDQSFLGNEENAIRAMQFAMTADKTIIAGDLFDYLSEGGAQVAKRLIFNYNVDYKGNFDTVRAIVGNHEETRAFGDIPDTGTVESNSAWLKDHWIEGQDPVYEMEIVRNANGKNPVMNIMIHNGSNDYRYITDEIYNQFLNDLNTAREQNIPVLIFQHISINVVDGMKHVTDSAAAPLTESKHYAANSNSYHERTKEMYNTITDNADVIKGIFAAHNHDFYYGEISGTGENGTGHIIPQVMVMSNTLGEGNVFRINVK